MTTTPYGFWMNRRGRLLPIIEHGRAIIEKPRRFGLTRAQVVAIVGIDAVAYNPQDRAPDSPRGRLYRLVMDGGWVRLRGGLSGWSIQFAGNAPRVARNLMRRVAEEYWGTYTSIHFEDLESGSSDALQPHHLNAIAAGGLSITPRANPQ